MTNNPDEDLRRLLHDAVDHVDPAERIGQIRERTQIVAPGPWRRRTAIGGVVLATAATVAAIAVLTTLLDEDSPGPAANPATIQVSPAKPRTSPSLASPSEAATPGGPGATQTVPAYFVGDGPRGPVLYRDFVTAEASEPRLLAALRALETAPGDPDYRSLWPRGSFGDASADDTEITIDLSAAVATERPAGWSERLASLAVQQAVYSAQGAVGQGRTPVRFVSDGEPVESVFGVPTVDPVTHAPILETLSLMSISYPFQGAEVTSRFTASGVANSFEANVVWRIEDAAGAVVKDGFTTAEGYLEPRLFPWEVQIDVADLLAGNYTFIASTDDPSGGVEGVGPHSDTRLVVID